MLVMLTGIEQSNRAITSDPFQTALYTQESKISHIVVFYSFICIPVNCFTEKMPPDFSFS